MTEQVLVIKYLLVFIPAQELYGFMPLQTHTIVDLKKLFCLVTRLISDAYTLLAKGKHKLITLCS